MRVIYGEDASAHIKAAVCKVHPTFRGGLCGLSENPCSRNDSPIPLARAKPGRGRQYGTGWPGGPQLPGQCLFRGCTPRSPNGGPGAAALGAFWGLFRGEKFPAGGNRPATLERFRRTDPPAAGLGRCLHRPLRRRRECGGTNGFMQPPRLPREAAHAARADVARKGALASADASTAAVQRRRG